MGNSDFFKNTAEVFKSLGSNDFGQVLIDTLRTHVSFDGSVIILFHPQRYPEVLQEGLEKRDKKVFWENYMHGVYILDPFYKLCIQGKKGMFHLQDIAPWNFLTSKYFKQYFNPADIKDEINFVFQAADGVSGLVCISRSGALRRFSKEERIELKEMSEFIDSAMTKHLEIVSARHENAPSRDQQILLQETLDKFTRDILTEREHEIANLMFRGLSSKASASFLAISPATERTHRKNIYKKMKINSHAEFLAHAFEYLLEEA